tara:strand:- start:587 stop:700 length:114 start_codon:yes stop_codon:yes gene_type:complete
MKTMIKEAILFGVIMGSMIFAIGIIIAKIIETIKYYL